MRLYTLALLAKVIALISMTLYLPLHVLNAISDYLYQYSGCSDYQEEEEQEILDEAKENENKVIGYEAHRAKVDDDEEDNDEEYYG